MLTEDFVAATLAPDKSTNTTLPGIHIHGIQPLASLRSTFKKSSSKSNCLAVSRTHVFAAQADKAVVHVYSRERNNQEATVPFSERISAVTLTGDRDGAGILALGTEGGRIILWELGTGRQVSTPPHHLQPVSCLAVDVTSNFLLSGSSDSNVHAWSIPTLLSFQTPTAQDSFQPDVSRAPRKSLTTHRGAVTAVVVGHGASVHNFSVSASEDKTCILWDYSSGEVLRTFLLAASPRCLALDPADRAFYVGYEDGSIHFVDFYRQADSLNPLFGDSSSSSSTATDIPASARWWPPKGESNSSSPILCLDLSFDATMLISGQENGKIWTWDIAKGVFNKQIMDCSTPITQIIVLPPTGFPSDHLNPARVKLQNVVKPRYEAFTASDQRSANGTHTNIPADYTFTAQFPSELPSSPLALIPGLDPGLSSFRAILASPCFPTSMMQDSLAEFQSALHAKHHPDADADTDMITETESTNAIADLTRTNESLTAQLRAARADLARRDHDDRLAKQDAAVKAARKKTRRLQRIRDEAGRRREVMGERIGSSGDDEGEGEQEGEGDEDGELSSSTDEMLDTD